MLSSNPNYDDPSTDTAIFREGTYDGRLGARSRLTKNGHMMDSDMALQTALENGLPRKIRGRPLGCGCGEAQLVTVSPAVDGVVEADYHCDAGWHNYVSFNVRQYAAEGQNSIKIDKYGNLTESEGFQAGELESL